MIDGHTCIVDDGGNPNRRCDACAAEKKGPKLVEISEEELKALRRSAQLHDATCFDRSGLIRKMSTLRGALEDIASADETSTLEGAVAIAKSALEMTK